MHNFHHFRLEGEVGNSVTDMTKQFGITEPVKPSTKWFLSSNGEMLPNEIADAFSSQAAKLMEKAEKSQLKSGPQILEE